MYLDRFVTGKYEIYGDTLELISHDFLETEYQLSKYEKLIVKKGLSRFLIKDSLLIPIAYKDLCPYSLSMHRDSSIIKEYLQNDGHVHYKLTFLADSTFKYSTGSDMDRHTINGTWRQEENIVKLKPNDSNNLIYWICTNNELTINENYLIGMTYDKDNGLVEYQYLIGLKQAASE